MAQNLENGTATAPPYLSFKTLANYVHSMRENGVVPARIDRSAIPGQSGAIQTYIIAAMKFLGLIDDNGIPTDDLHGLVTAATDEDRKKVLEIIVRRSYAFVLESDLDLERATRQQLEEKFGKTGIKGTTVRKAHAFFAQIADAAGIALPTLWKPRRSTGGGQRRPRRRRSAQSNQETPSTPEPRKSVHEMLLDKFPDFDPGWPQDMQSKWFDAFDRLMKSAEDSQ